jgi:hypothetical protein
LNISWYLDTDERNYNKVSASVWIRCLQLISYLEKLGINSVFNKSEKVDLAVFVRWQNEEAFSLAESLKEKGVKVVLDLCVNYLDVTGELGRGYGVSPDQQKEVLKMINISDAVFCASDHITQRVKQEHDQVYYLSDSVDFSVFKYRKELSEYDKKKINLSYSGVSTKTNYFFDEIYPHLDLHKFKLSLIMEKRKPFFRRYKFIKWDYYNFPYDLSRQDIGMAPRIISNTYDQGHSVFKIAVYLAQGIPVLASPVPSYFEIFNYHNVGRICLTPNDWKEAFEFIYEEREEVKKWSEAAVDSVRSFSSEELAEQYLRAFKSILSR